MIKIQEMKDRHTYKIEARNATVGIWIAKDKQFLISRFKFGTNFLHVEEHWDNGAPYGTAKPIQEIEKTPLTIEELNSCTTSEITKVLTYLNSLERR